MKKLFFLIPLLLFLMPSFTKAFTVDSVNDPNNYLDLPPFYNSQKDEIRVNLKTREITNVIWDFVSSDTGTNHQKISIAPTGSWYVASGFTCIGTYTNTFKNRNGDTLATITITIEDGDLVNPKCNSDGSGETGDDFTSSFDSIACANAVCECINDLIQVNQSINQSINSNGITLNEVLGELKRNDSVGSGSVPSFDIPSISGRIEVNKPDEKPVFEDNSIYFKDEGDAPPVGKMPNVPDVKDWDGVIRENEAIPEGELSKDLEGKKENELNKDTEKKIDNELSLDEFNKEDELSKIKFDKDEELGKIEFNQDIELDKEVMEQSDNFIKSPELKQNHEYEQTNQFD